MCGILGTLPSTQTEQFKQALDQLYSIKSGFRLGNMKIPRN
jgi:hypothetical protein